MSISPHPHLVAPALLLLEVMDKEPPLAQRAILYGVLSGLGVLLARKRWWLGLLVLPVVAVFAWVDVSELHDPFVGPAIIREAGLLHVLVWYAFILAGIGVPVLTAAIVRCGKSSRSDEPGHTVMRMTEKRSRWVYLLPATHLCACLISLSGSLVPQLQILGIVWVFIVLIDLPVSAIFYALAWNHGVIAGIWVIVVGTWWWYFLGRKVERLINKIRSRTGLVPTV